MTALADLRRRVRDLEAALEAARDDDDSGAVELLELVAASALGLARGEALGEARRGGRMASRCDRCGETVTDLDAGFSPGLHQMGHGCGGTWRRVPADPRLDRLRALLADGPASLGREAAAAAVEALARGDRVGAAEGALRAVLEHPSWGDLAREVLGLEQEGDDGR